MYVLPTTNQPPVAEHQHLGRGSSASEQEMLHQGAEPYIPHPDSRRHLETTTEKKSPKANS
jgi:hypothetical protein